MKDISMNSTQFSTLMSRACATIAMLLLFGCGGGGGGTSASVSGGIGGTGVKGPVGGATVTALAITNGVKGAQIATAMTNASGNNIGGFNLNMGKYGGAVMLQLSGGSYTDEATGSTMTMTGGNVMTAVIPAFTAGTTLNGIQITPLTSMAQTMAQSMAGGMTPANITTANAGVGNYCTVSDILTVKPMDPTQLNSGNTATTDQADYGMCVAAMSQYAVDHAIPSSAEVVTAMMGDASDGVMNGMMSQMMGGGSVMIGGGAMLANAGTSGLASAMSNFMSNQNRNQSGLSLSAQNPTLLDQAMITLHQKLLTSPGTL
jgi:hypothetical protein